MPILRLNSGPFLPSPATGDPLRPALERALSHLPNGAPIVVLLHGLRFSPFLNGHDPHGHIYGLNPTPRCAKARSWPLALGFGGPDAARGLCLPFAWDGALKLGEGYRRAGQAGRQLGALLTLIAGLSSAPIHLFAHSLGARVALRALATTRAPITRAVLLNPAEFQTPAAHALSSPSGQRAEIVQVTATENRAFDTLFQLAAPRRRRTDIALGLRSPRAPNWHILSISNPNTRAHLARIGFPIAAPQSRLCHWSTYTRPGLFALYRALTTAPEPFPLTDLAPSPNLPKPNRTPLHCSKKTPAGGSATSHNARPPTLTP